MQSIKVIGDAVFDGERVMLALEPTHPAPGRRDGNPHDEPPNAAELVESIRQGEVPCHPTCVPVSIQQIQVLINNVKTKMQFRGSNQIWSSAAQESLLTTLSKPKRHANGRATVTKGQAITNGEEITNPAVASITSGEEIINPAMASMDACPEEPPILVVGNAGHETAVSEDVTHKRPHVDNDNVDNSGNTHSKKSKNGVNDTETDDNKSHQDVKDDVAEVTNKSSSPSSSSSSSSSSSMPKAELRRRILTLQSDLEEVTRDLYLANDTLGLNM